MRRRLFTFGCSYTSYSWPTWADLLGMAFAESKNFGLAGIGNRAIAERVAEANARYNFTKDDVVIVQWSSHLRNDFHHPYSLPKRIGFWKTCGSIFNYINESLYDKKWIETFFFEPSYFMHTLNHISLTQGLLESTGATWYMSSIGDIRNMGSDLRDNAGIGEHTHFLTPYDRTRPHVAWEKLPELKMYDTGIWQKYAEHWLTPMEYTAVENKDLTFSFADTVNSGDFLDTHPSTAQHMIWLRQELSDKLTLSNNQLQEMDKVSEAVQNLHTRFRFNKHSFELMLAKRTDFPAATLLKWPFTYEGF